MGFQVCAADGGAYGPCECRSAEDSGAIASDATGNSETGTSNTGMEAGPSGAADAAACEAGTAPVPNGMYVSNPPAVQTSTSNGLSLHKELSGYVGYGAQDGAADILYEGQVAAWTFAIPDVTIKSATVVVSMVADDHSTVPISQYSFRIWAGACTDAGLALPHGSPANANFSNWVPVSEPENLVSGGTFTLTIANTSMTGSTTNWIGIDSADLNLVTQ